MPPWLLVNAPALMGLGAVLSVLVAGFTIPLLYATQRAARETAAAARDQAEAARQLAEVAHVQLTAANESAAAEREHSLLIRKQMLAQLRPVLVVIRRTNPELLPDGTHLPDLVFCANESTGVALQVSAHYGFAGPDGENIQAQSVIGANHRSWLPGCSMERLRAEGVFIEYCSEDGREYVTRATADASGFIQNFIAELDEAASAFTA